MYRFFEIFPGALSWLTIFLMVLLSWLKPGFVAVFIILFDIYWFLKTIYLSLHLRSTFSVMKKNLKVDWLEKLKNELPGRWEKIHHLVILPMYREPYGVIRESFESLTNGNYPLDKFAVVLATEERAGAEAAETAKKMEREFGPRFSRFLITTHPANLPGEIPGKGSNETWAAKQAKEKIIDALGIPHDDVLVSVFDVDTQIFSDYFGRLTYVFLKADDKLRAIYQPIPLFTNNIYQAPALARVISFSSTFWQMMQQSRPERLTSFSSQSIPFSALLDVGYWHTDIVSEDSRIFWQCYLHYHGDFRVEPLFYPVSMDANAAPTFLGTLKNNYLQHRRWAWGCENIPYLMCGKPHNSDANDANTMRILRMDESNSHHDIRGIRGTRIVEKDLSYRLNGILFRIHNRLGRFCRERQYGDAFAQELEKENIRFRREAGTEVAGRTSNFLDFVVEERIVIEFKAKSFLDKEDYYQLQRYLQTVNLKLGLIVNFRNRHLKPHRVLNPLIESPKPFVDSHTFADSHRREGFLYDKKIPLWKKWYWSFITVEGFHSWATNALMIFALGWLPVILGGGRFNQSLLSYSLPSVARFVIELSMVGVATTAFLSVLLLPPRYGPASPEGGPPRPKPMRFHEYVWHVAQWLLLPVTLIVFGCIPALESQTRMLLGGKWRLGFWPTPKYRMQHSNKL